MTELRTPWSVTRRLQPWRVLLYAALVLLAAVFLLPVYVMLANSFKPLDEIRSGHLLALPCQWTLAPWRSAWSTAQIGVQPTGLRPFFLNSFLVAVPSVLLSTALGALNGCILTQFCASRGSTGPRSSTHTLAPLSASCRATAEPPTPEPMMSTSQSSPLCAMAVMRSAPGWRHRSRPAETGRSAGVPCPRRATAHRAAAAR